MIDKELQICPHPRRVIVENAKFGLFKGHFVKELERIKELLKEKQINQQDSSLRVSEAMEIFQRVQEISKHAKEGTFTDIFITTEKRYDYSYDSYRYSLGFEYGRYETDEEYYDRLKREKEHNEQYESEKLKKEAAQYLALKMKFKDGE